MNTVLWKGFHSQGLYEAVRSAWISDDLLVICPPWLSDLEFAQLLPEGSRKLRGDWCVKPDVPLQGIKLSEYPDKPVLGVFTTGTASGKPKLVLYSKKNIKSSLSGILSFFEDSRIGNIFCYPQAFHTFGLLIGYVLSITKEIPVHFSEGPYSREAHSLWMDNVGENTLTLGAPAHFLDLMSVVNEKDFIPPMSYSCIIGGAPVNVALWRSLRDKLKIEKPSIGYGATEASPAVTHLPPGLSPKETGEIGFGLPHLKIKADPEKGLSFSGDSVCLAIIDNGEVNFPNKIILRDKVRQRDDGSFVYEGRLDFILNRGGEKFSLEKIEEILRTELNLEAVCVRVPDKRLGEDLGILIKLKKENAVDLSLADKVREILKKSYAKDFKNSPIHFESSIPLNSNSKIDRYACQEKVQNASTL